MMGHTRRDHLAPPRVPRHKVWLNQSGCYFDIRIHKYPVQPHRYLMGCCGTQCNTALVIASIMVFHPHILQYPGITQ